MDLQMDGKVVIVTASGGGIGHAILEQLVQEGAVAVGASSRPGDGETIVTDLNDSGSGDFIAKEVRRRYGRLDALVTVLGGPEPSVAGFGARDDRRWQRAFDFNVMSGVRMLRACLPLLAEAPSASIVHIGSDLGRQPDPLFVEYAAMKSALLSISKSLSIELGPRIRSNVLSPGPTRTSGLLRDFEKELAPAWGVTTEEAVEHYVRNIRTMPSRRLGLPEEVARAAAFLASPVSAPMTGTEVVVDGGTRKAT